MGKKMIVAAAAAVLMAWYCAAARPPMKLGCQLWGVKDLWFDKSDKLAELVCSNSLKAERLASAAGLLKHEMQMLGYMDDDVFGRISSLITKYLNISQTIISITQYGH